jgi:tRNA U38,U39,U40 pseudouridine synthase TruA
MAKSMQPIRSMSVAGAAFLHHVSRQLVLLLILNRDQELGAAHVDVF